MSARAWWWPLAVVACGAARETPPPPPTAIAVCPRFVDATEPWASQVFPGCAPLPFGFRAAVCGTACPKPCAWHRKAPHRDGNNLVMVEVAYAVAYDDAGRLASITSPVTDFFDLDCDGDRCRYRTGDAYEAERDARHRIVAVHTPTGVTRYRYGDDGVTEMTEDDRTVTFTYGPDHRLATERLTFPTFDNEITYHYDKLGRPDSTTATRGERERFTYDAAGHLSHFELHAFPNQPYTIDYEFDDRGRPVRATTNDGRGSTDTMSWDYDCKP